MSSGSGGNNTTTQNSSPWSGQQPYLSGIYQQAANLYNQGSVPQYYPGSTVAAQSPETLQAQQMAMSRATNGSATMGAANQYTQNTLNGNYLNPGNPYTDQLFQAINSRVTPQVMGAYSAAGRSPGLSGGYAESAARGLTEGMAPSLFQNYQNERGLQQQAAQNSPALANQDWTDIGQAAQVGQQRDQYGQQLLGDQINRWDYQQNLPYQKLGALAQIIQGGYPGGQTVTKQPTTSPLGSILGGVLGAVL